MQIIATVAVVAAAVAVAPAVTQCAPITRSSTGVANQIMHFPLSVATATLEPSLALAPEMTRRSVSTTQVVTFVEATKVEKLDSKQIHRRGITRDADKAVDFLVEGASKSTDHVSEDLDSKAPAWQVLLDPDYKPITQASPSVTEALSVMKSLYSKVTSGGPAGLRLLSPSERSDYDTMRWRLYRYLEREKKGKGRDYSLRDLSHASAEQRWVFDLSGGTRKKLKLRADGDFHLKDLEPNERRELSRLYKKNQRRLQRELRNLREAAEATPDAVNSALVPTHPPNNAPNPLTSAPHVHSSSSGDSTPPGSDAAPGTPQQPSLKRLRSFNLNEIWVEPTQPHERPADFPSGEKQAI